MITDLRTNNALPFNIKITEDSTDNHNGIIFREVSRFKIYHIFYIKKVVFGGANDRDKRDKKEKELLIR